VLVYSIVALAGLAAAALAMVLKSMPRLGRMCEG
jgi:hypothetical protein